MHFSFPAHSPSKVQNSPTLNFIAEQNLKNTRNYYKILSSPIKMLITNNDKLILSWTYFYTIVVKHAKLRNIHTENIIFDNDSHKDFTSTASININSLYTIQILAILSIISLPINQY